MSLVGERIDGSALIARSGCVLVGAWWSTATLEHVASFRAVTEQILAEHAGFATAILILDGEGVFRFPEDVRSELVALVADTEDVGWGTAFVVLRGGFVGAAVRTFLSGLFLVARSKEPQRAFGELPSAATWLADRVARTSPSAAPSAEALAETLAEARRRADEARGA